MSVKRYKPRYKKLTKFRPPLWFERRKKFLDLTKEKWLRVIKPLFKRKFEYYYQDVLSISVNKKYYSRRARRMKKTFKFHLRNRQRVQIFYSNNRLRFFQLKALARKSIKIANNKKLIKPTVFLSLLENRLFNLLYRLGYVRFLEQGKQIIMNGHFKVEDNEIKNYNYTINKWDFIQPDPKILYLINYYYVQHNHSFFYYKRRKKVRKIILEKIKFFDKSIGCNFMRKDEKIIIKNLKKCKILMKKLQK